MVLWYSYASRNPTNAAQDHLPALLFPTRCTVNLKNMSIIVTLDSVVPRTSIMIMWVSYPQRILNEFMLVCWCSDWSSGSLAPGYVGYNYCITFHALSCVDPSHSFIELVRVSNTLSAHVASKFHNHRLFCHTPTLSHCIHEDNGPKFVGQEFQDVLHYYGVLMDCPTTSTNPLVKSFVERAHQTVASMLQNMA